MPPGQSGNGDVTAFFPEAKDGLPVSPAPRLDLPAPEMVVLSDTASGGVRTLSLRLRSPRRASAVYLYLNPEATVRSLALSGQQIDGPDWDPEQAQSGRPWSLDYWAPPPEGFDLTLHLDAGAPSASPWSITPLACPPRSPASPTSPARPT